MTYTEYDTYMRTLLVIDASTETQYTTILPLMIVYSENRIYADLDLLSTQTTATANLTPLLRNVTVPTNIQIVQGANIVTPAATNPDSGTRNPIQRVSLDYINFVWPTAVTPLTTPSVPTMYALVSDTAGVVAPAPDAAYKMEFIGIFRPTALSNANQTTWISLNIPELFVAGSMVFGAGYQRDFGQSSDDPRMSMSWEQQYQLLLKSDTVQEARRKAQSSGWQPFSPAPLARVPRS